MKHNSNCHFTSQIKQFLMKISLPTRYFNLRWSNIAHLNNVLKITVFDMENFVDCNCFMAIWLRSRHSTAYSIGEISSRN